MKRPHLKVALDFLDTLVYELVHAVDKYESAHGEGFERIALVVGLKGSMRSAGVGENLKQELIRISDKLVSFTHGRLSLPISVAQKVPKRPGAKCSYEVVMLKRYLHIGPPLCAKDVVEMVATGDWEG